MSTILIGHRRRGASSLAMFAVAGLVQLALVAPTLCGQGKWVSLPPFPEPHEEVIGQGANGKMYVFAGLVSAPVWLPVGMVYEFDPATSKWAKRKPMALPAHHLALTEYRRKNLCVRRIYRGYSRRSLGLDSDRQCL